MDTVMFDGVEYVKAAVVAKQFRYTADYIGQLCRGKKIDARLVGRTWFVNLDSLKEHKLSRHQNKPTEESSNTGVKDASKNDTRTSRKHEIAPRVKTATLKQTKQSSVDEQSQRHLKVSYEPDDENLIPNLRTKQVRAPQTIRIEHVDAQRLHITGKKDETFFQAGELPEVSLSGKLEVTSYQNTEDEANEDDIEAKVVPQETQSSFINKVISAKQKINIATDKTTMTSVSEVAQSSVLAKSDKNHFNQQGGAVAGKQSLNPDSTGPDFQKSDFKAPSSFTPRSVIKTPEVKVSMLMLTSPLIATLIAATCVFLIMSASIDVVVTETSYESHLTLQVANMLELLQR
jgi:hypothetical protein